MLRSLGIAVLVVGLVALAGLILGFPIWSYPRRQEAEAERRRRIAARGLMGRDRWYEAYFAPEGLSRLVVEEIVGLLATCLECDLTSLRPTDAFGAELAFPPFRFLWMTDDEDQELELFDAELEDWLTDHGAERLEMWAPAGRGRFPHVRTVGDLLRCCEPFLSKKAAGAGRDDEDF
jgi:hypothetical protein